MCSALIFEFLIWPFLPKTSSCSATIIIFSSSFHRIGEGYRIGHLLCNELQVCMLTSTAISQFTTTKAPSGDLILFSVNRHVVHPQPQCCFDTLRQSCSYTPHRRPLGIGLPSGALPSPLPVGTPALKPLPLVNISMLVAITSILPPVISSRIKCMLRS